MSVFFLLPRLSGWRRPAFPARIALAMAWMATAMGVCAEPLIRIGVLPVESPLETRNAWTPFAEGLTAAVGTPTRLVAPTSYDAMMQTLRQGGIDLAVLSGSMVVDTVAHHGMTVIARALPADSSRHRTVLVARRGAAPATLEHMLRQPGRWKLARGESRSLSGYLIPQSQLFLPRGLRMEAFFTAEVPGGPQTNMLAVANGEVDVGITTGTELARFQERFPNEAARITVLWQSEPLPAALAVVRKGLPDSLRMRLAAHLADLGRSPAGREALRRRHALAGFELAGDDAILPHAYLIYRLERQSALQGRWTDESARTTRLMRIDEGYAALRASLAEKQRPAHYVMPSSHAR
ncbi:phosphate/phosphite/phosphonate ABC transporter substrate-binding protein [uncultured Pigmentiphaga sp.]|uniref:phosphate/phosphite/phosphonate ABC transporter substrate-binding protein n=1 Tax=uncultured Pigmentiphaga sp. TaxID=340361 RepID=UPI00262CA67F|nr:phosphate/phosphite/phosphonate ABC transporter substrate-binding protein [uncultured Pigmentiphaga sp.]